MKDYKQYPPNMPGSLLISNDSLSDRSDISTRSLDSKIAGKKVSFNKAVRVKQYPWTPDVPDSQNGDHLTLPNSRFWFKVYKNRQEPPNNSQWKQPDVSASWEEDNMECIHDSLAPIAEDEDQDLDTDKSQESPSFYDRFGRRINNDAPSANTGVRAFNGGLRKDYATNGYSSEPPIDYFEERNGFNNRNLINGNHKPSWGVTTNGERRGLFDKSLYRHEHENSDSWRKENGITPTRKEWSDHNQHSPVTRDISIENVKLPRMFIRDDSPRKQIENRWNAAGSLKPRERRSRSHDDILDNEINVRSLRKADKSVSTEDLNSNMEENNDTSPYRLFKRSRDIATQCYGTLTKSKGSESALGNQNSPLFTRSTFNSSLTNGGTGNANDSKFSRPSLNPNGVKTYSTPSTRFLNRSTYDQNNQNSENNRAGAKVNGRASSILSPSNGKNFTSSYRRNELPPSGKMVTPNKHTTVGDHSSTTYDYVQKPAGLATKAGYPSRETRASQLSNFESLKGKGNNRAQDLRPTATVGYVRGRQIPLNEANPNSVKKMSSKIETRLRNPIPLPKTGRGLSSLSGRTLTEKFDAATASEPGTKYFSSNFESSKGRNFNLRNGSNSTKNGSSGFDDTQSMIDWSLSGFQLATHPENRITSISDSECTVHRRPPLLMYIPGVSHHDRPAIEDDRLSALSDMSRSELNDDIGPLASVHGMDRGFQSDIRRRHSMPRDGKLKWIKWKSNGQR